MRDTIGIDLPTFNAQSQIGIGAEVSELTDEIRQILKANPEQIELMMSDAKHRTSLPR